MAKIAKDRLFLLENVLMLNYMFYKVRGYILAFFNSVGHSLNLFIHRIRFFASDKVKFVASGIGAVLVITGFALFLATQGNVSALAGLATPNFCLGATNSAGQCTSPEATIITYAPGGSYYWTSTAYRRPEGWAYEWDIYSWNSTNSSYVLVGHVSCAQKGVIYPSPGTPLPNDGLNIVAGQDLFVSGPGGGITIQSLKLKVESKVASNVASSLSRTYEKKTTDVPDANGDIWRTINFTLSSPPAQGENICVNAYGMFQTETTELPGWATGPDFRPPDNSSSCSYIVEANGSYSFAFNMKNWSNGWYFFLLNVGGGSSSSGILRINQADPVYDNVNLYSIEYEGLWPDGATGNLCVNVYGPYQYPQGEQSNAYRPAAMLKTSQCKPVGYLGNYQYAFDTYSWRPGYYYFTEDLNDVSGAILDGNEHHSNFAIADQSETVIVRFQPYAISDITDSDGNNAKYVRQDASEVIRDTLLFKATGAIQHANNKVDTTEPDWLKNNASDYVKVNFCVTAYGPYQQPQSRIDNLPTVGLNSNSLIGVLNGRLQSAIPETFAASGGENRQATICHTANGPDTTQNYDFNTSGWVAGYYYFVSTMNKHDWYYDGYLLPPEHSPASQNNSMHQDDLLVTDWISEFNPSSTAVFSSDDDEWGYVQFQPFATSGILGGDNTDGDGTSPPGQFVDPGRTEFITDALSIKVADSLIGANNGNATSNTRWPKTDATNYVDVNFCVTVYGPYQSPQSRINNIPAAAPTAVSGSLANGVPDMSAKTKSTVCHTADGPEAPMGAGKGDKLLFTFPTSGWGAGYYYFVTTVNKENNHYNALLKSGISQGAGEGGQNQGIAPTYNIPVSNMMIADWISEFNPGDEAEWAVAQSQPFATSSAARVWVDDGASTITDTLTAHSAPNMAEANNGYQAGIDSDSNWLRDGNGAYEKQKFCVAVYGPYQTAQEMQEYSYMPGGATGENAAPGMQPDGFIPVDPNGLASFVGGAKCTGQPGEPADFDGPGTSRTFTWNTSNWTPGYYYFMSYYRKSNPTTVPSGNPTDLKGNNNSPLVIGNWTSHFNPVGEKEVVADKFQLKAASTTRSSNSYNDPSPLVVNTGIVADTTGHMNEPDGVVDAKDGSNDGTVPVLKPTDKYIEDSIYIRAYDTNSSNLTGDADDEKFWLKDTSGMYITFYVCANIYGPYQQPQPRLEAAGNNSMGTVASQHDNIPVNIYGNKNTRQQCFWTNRLQDEAGNDDMLSLETTITNGLVQKPSASGGPGEYKVRFSNSEYGTDYFKPGYYYIVWNVDTNPTNATSSDADPSGGTCTAVTNTCATTVDLGKDRVTRRNGDFLVSDWYSPFGEQSEAFYSQFQPIAKSEIPTYVGDDTTDGVSDRKKAANSADKSENSGIVLSCKENIYNYSTTYTDGPMLRPEEFLHCDGVLDKVWLGAVDNRAIATDASNGVDDYHKNVNFEINGSNFGGGESNLNNYKYWPKDKDGLYESMKYQVKLYGPFKDAQDRVPSNAAGYVGNSVLGTNGEWTSTSSTVPNSVLSAQSIYGQPIAETCVITIGGKNGPNWNESIEDAYPIGANTEETNSQFVFTQDFKSCNSSGVPSNREILLPPGFYVSIVEIVRDDIVNSKKIPGSSPVAEVDDGNASQVGNMHNMIIRNRFTSAWGDKQESLMVPLPIYLVTRRGDSDADVFYNQSVEANDRYWVAGFDAKYVGRDADGKLVQRRWTDIWGSPIPKYGEYKGHAGYYGADPNPEDENILARFFGAYPLAGGQPDDDGKFCLPAEKSIYTWLLPVRDTVDAGELLPSPAPFRVSDKGYYVFQYYYHGGERVSSLKTQCGDNSEQFSIWPEKIRLVTQAQPKGAYAPTKLYDDIEITGTFEEGYKGSWVKLSLYKSARGKEHRPGTPEAPGLDGEPLCTAVFSVDTIGTYSTSKFIDNNGYFKDEFPGVVGSGRCWAETAGHYYWIEEFLHRRSDNNYVDPVESDYIQPKGTGGGHENIDITEPPLPKVTTFADPTQSVNQPFQDLALVENIPEGNTKEYKLYFSAYGPFTDGRVDCTNNLIYSSAGNPISVTENGTYKSQSITVSTNGIVYWVETLLDENDEVVAQGECGARNENTYIVAPPPLPGGNFEQFQPFYPLYPDAGYISRQAWKIISFSAIMMVGAWQLTNKNSWLLRRRK